MRRNVAVVLLFIFAGIASSANTPTEIQPPANENKGSATNQKKAETINAAPNQTPSVIDFVTSNGLEKISNYCASHSNTEPGKWLHEKLICDVHVTDVAIAVFSGLLVVVTTGLIIVGFAQWRETRNTAKRQLRAYVFVDAASIKGLEDESVPLATMNIKNSGQTPAFKVINIGEMALTDYPPAANFRFQPPGPEKVPHSRASLGPGMEVRKFHPGARALTSAEKEALKNGTMVIYVFGQITYEDAFGRDWFTDYRYMVGGPAGVRETRLAQCEDGNDAK